MKKIVVLLATAAIALPVIAQIKSTVIKNTVNDEVFSIEYGAGPATVNVPGGTIVTGSGTVAAFKVNTGANIVFTSIVPDSAGQVLLTPNSTNTYTLVDSEAHTITLVRRAAINMDGTTNGWRDIVIAVQP
jgi:hypothetical protein